MKGTVPADSRGTPLQMRTSDEAVTAFSVGCGSCPKLAADCAESTPPSWGSIPGRAITIRTIHSQRVPLGFSSSGTQAMNLSERCTISDYLGF